MRIIAVTAVRNEQDIIEAFLRHTAAFVDRHLVLDNGSTDQTADIIRSLVAEGLDIVVDRDPTLGYYQAERMTSLMHRAAGEHGADWVVPLDADEFISAHSPAAFRATLFEHDTPVLMRWTSYIPSPSDDQSETNVVVRMKRRLVREYAETNKVVVPGHLAGTEALLQGSHDLASEAARSSVVLTDLSLAHFPVRSPAQFAAKVAVATFQYLARVSRHDWGYHYAEPFEILMEGWEAFHDQYFVQARRYGLRPGVSFDGAEIEDPLSYQGTHLKYTSNDRSEDPLQSILEYGIDISRRYGEIVGEGWSPPAVRIGGLGGGGSLSMKTPSTVQAIGTMLGRSGGIVAE